MSDNDDADGSHAKERELAENPEARGTKDERLGAIVLHSTPLDAAKQVRALLTSGFRLEARGR